MLSMILALGRNGAMGRAGGLPWSCPEDRAHFVAVTQGHAVLMGRRTWDEEGRPLPGRTNVVVSSTFVPPAGVDVRVARTLDEATRLVQRIDPDPIVIGGAVLFTAALPLVGRIYLTEIPESPTADVYFTFDRAPFDVVSTRDGRQGERYLILERRRA